MVLILILPFFVVRFLLFLFTECTRPSSRHAHRTYTPLDPLPPLPLLLCFLHLVSSRAINFTIPCCAFIKCLFKVLILYVWGLCIVLYCVRVCVEREDEWVRSKCACVCCLNLRGHVMTRCLVTGEQFFVFFVVFFYFFLPRMNVCAVETGSDSGDCPHPLRTTGNASHSAGNEQW